MATDPKLVRRLQALEEAIDTRVRELNERLSKQALEIERITLELASQKEASVGLTLELQQQFKAQQETSLKLQEELSAVRGAQKAGIAGGTMVDTRLLGRPDIYQGDATKWRDWKLVFTAFCGAVNTHGFGAEAER